MNKLPLIKNLKTRESITVGVALAGVVCVLCIAFTYSREIHFSSLLRDFGYYLLNLILKYFFRYEHL